MATKIVSAAAIPSLKEALCSIYWYKSDLRSFLQNCLSNKSVLNNADWQGYKRQIVSDVVDYLCADQDRYIFLIQLLWQCYGWDGSDIELQVRLVAAAWITVAACTSPIFIACPEGRFIKVFVWLTIADVCVFSRFHNDSLSSSLSSSLINRVSNHAKDAKADDEQEHFRWCKC